MRPSPQGKRQGAGGLQPRQLLGCAAQADGAVGGDVGGDGGPLIERLCLTQAIDQAQAQLGYSPARLMDG